MSSSNHIVNVAFVGAGGNSGSFMAGEILKTGKHKVTALTRVGSDSKIAEGIPVKEVDYEKPETIVEALRGQDALIITLTGFAPQDVHTKLIDAAGEAGVRWIFPNEWSPDTANPEMTKDVAIYQPKAAIRDYIINGGKSSIIALSTGFWYEWSLPIPPAFGIDIKNRKATFFDDGNTKISVSTWPHVGRAVAALVSLPIKPEAGSDPAACLEALKNKLLYTQSFTISQRDMLASVLRVTGGKESDWTLTSEPSHERYANGITKMKAGDRIGFAEMMYTRVFYPDGAGDTEHSKDPINALLNLPKEDLDEATVRAVERTKLPQWHDQK